LFGVFHVHVHVEVVDLDIFDVGNFVECGRRRRGRFMTGPQLAQAGIQFLVVFDVVFDAAASGRGSVFAWPVFAWPVFARAILTWAILARPIFARASSAFHAATALAMAARSALFALGVRPLLQIWSLVAGRTFRSRVFHFWLGFELRPLGGRCFRFWLGLRRRLHAKLAQHAPPVVAPLGCGLRRCRF
jgi:hypothetical protein